jgi:glycine cleavage system transcriptional repressor
MLEKNTMNNYLVITALGQDKPGIIQTLSKKVSESGCNIEDSRMSVLGGEFAVMLLVSGQWNTIAKLEDQLPELEKQLEMTIVSRQTKPRNISTEAMPYAADVISIDNPGIVSQLAEFFSSKKINIKELETTRYAAAHTGTPMFSVHMEIEVPGNTKISGLREEFLDFCDNINLDAVLEPIKH